MPEKYIVDVDTGVDDAQALLLALACPDVEVLAITCVAGNCNVDQVCLNTLKVLSVCDRLDIPVYRGASRAMVGDKLEATHYHGMDGLGDANLDVEVSPDLVQKEHAVNALLSLVNKYPGEVTLVALAPLTNIALALRQDPDFGKKLKKVLVMGGNTEGRGNSLLCAEFNFASDPEAAYVILNELGTNIVIFPWEINLSTAVGQSWEWYEQWAQTDTAKGRFNRAIAKNIVHFQRIVQKRPIFRSCDLNAMAVAIDPNVVMETEDVYATVELHGKFTRGMMVVDWRGSLGKSPNITLVKRINTDLTRSLFDKML